MNTAGNDVLTRAQRIGWPAALVLAAVAGSLVTSCMMPFVALAVVAAWSLPLRSAAATVGAAWLINQMIGFGLLHYPATGSSFLWGTAAGVASFVSLAVARPVLRQAAGAHVIGVGAAFALAFVAYEGLLYALACVAGGRETFAPAIVLRIAEVNVIFLVALLLLHQLLRRVAPGWFARRRPAALRPA